MGLFGRSRARRGSVRVSSDEPSGRQADKQAREATLAHLQDFTTTRVGVEAYVEPATNVTPTTVMLVATDGEWTRRRVPDAKAAAQLATTLGIPVYDVQRTGYPQRVRDWNARQRIERRRASS